MKCFEPNDRVTVLAEGGWKRSFSGKVASEAELVETLKGPEWLYWVQFDEPQEDVNGEDQYYKSQVLGCYLRRGA